mmetsp:Transcript_5126/g.7552  ORF Transcript_5126/g.7552 Transcript_5126/m.7552 type:complete len:98 (+) Transcript_5126:459-752(+)
MVYCMYFTTPLLSSIEPRLVPSPRLSAHEFGTLHPRAAYKSIDDVSATVAPQTRLQQHVTKNDFPHYIHEPQRVQNADRSHRLKLFWMALITKLRWT